MAESFRSGDALFAFGADLSIVLWNAEAEHLTGIPADEALGRPCWDVLRAVDERGAIVCHPGCSGARLAREGWPVPCRRFLIKTADGRKLVSASTVTVQLPGQELVVLQLLRNGHPLADEDAQPVRLTRRQRQVLALLAEGLPAKVIARRLEIAEATVRNHIQALLTELGCHSQLQAVAEARRRGLL
ncbi:MAG TPA: LuxR C-terminal-related transcriptional regulator [Gaiellaceae bacterium]|nr:LuxR C-terminal-related transcriptional regulator [Gaiellaceae bacterium]